MAKRISNRTTLTPRQARIVAEHKAKVRAEYAGIRPIKNRRPIAHQEIDLEQLSETEHKILERLRLPSKSESSIRNIAKNLNISVGTVNRAIARIKRVKDLELPSQLKKLQK